MTPKVQPVGGISWDLQRHAHSEQEKQRQRDKKLETFTKALQDAVKEGSYDPDGSGRKVR